MAENLEKFSGLDREIALKLIAKHKGSIVVAQHLERFSGLDREIAMKLIKG